MATSYPSGIDSFSDKQNNVDWVEAADINNLQDAVEAIETELGTNPSGTYSDVGDAITGKVNRSGDTLTGELDFDKYEALNFKAEMISTSSLPTWTAEDEGRIVYWEETDRLYVGDDSGWISVGQLTAGDGINISGSQVSIDGTVVRTTGNQSIDGLKDFTYNSIRIGDGTSGSHKVIEAYISESGNPAIRYNKDTETWQYSDDGSSYEDLMHLEQGDGVSVSGSQISVDSTVLRTTGAQSISGVKTVTATPAGTGLTDASLIINPSSANNDDLLLGLGVNDSQVFAVDGTGDVKLTGTLEWSDANLYRLAADQLKTDDRLEVGGPSQGANTAFKVNASSADAGSKLIWVGVNGSEKFSVNDSGDIDIIGLLDVTGTPDGANPTLKINPSTAGSENKLLWVGVNGTPMFTVDDSGDIVLAGEVGCDLTINDNYKLQWSDVNLYRSSTDILKTDDKLEIVGAADALNAALKVNPSSAASSSKIVWVGVNGTEIFSINDTGNTDISGLATITGIPFASGPSLKVNPSEAGADNRLLWLGVNGTEKFGVDDAGDTGISGLVEINGSPGESTATLKVNPSTAESGRDLLWTGVNGTVKFSVDESGNIELAGQLNSDLTLGDSYKLQWSDVNLYRSSANILKTDDRIEIIGTPDATTPSIKVNPASASTGEKLIWLGVNSTEKFSVDDSGDTEVAGNLGVDGTIEIGEDVNLYRSAADVLKSDDRLELVGTPDGSTPSVKINPSSASTDDKLIWSGVNGSEKFSVNDSGDTQIAGDGYIEGDIDVDGICLVTGNPTAGISGSSLLVNPSNPPEDTLLLALANNGDEVLTVSEAGDLEMKGFFEIDLEDSLEADEALIEVSAQSGASGSMLMDLQVGMDSVFSIDIDGSIDTDGRCMITGNPSEGISSSSLFVNPSSPEMDSYLMTIANNGDPVWSVTEAGDMEMQGFFLLNNTEELESEDVVMEVSAQSGASGSMMMDMSLAGNSIFSIDLDGNVEADGYIEGNLRCANTGSGAPADGDDGDIYIDTTNNRLYVKISGNWKYAALT